MSPQSQVSPGHISLLPACGHQSASVPSGPSQQSGLHPHNWSHSQGQSLMLLKIVSRIMAWYYKSGGVAQMVERSLSMREVLGSIPSTSTKLSFDFSFLLFVHFSTFLLLTKMSDCLSIQCPNIMKLNYQMPCLNQTAIFSKIFQFQA